MKVFLRGRIIFSRKFIIFEPSPYSEILILSTFLFNEKNIKLYHIYVGAFSQLIKTLSTLPLPPLPLLPDSILTLSPSLLCPHNFRDVTVLIIHCIVVWKCQFVFNKENWLEHKNMILASEEPDSQPAIRHSAPATTCCYHNEGRLLTQRFYDNILSPDIYIILVLKKFRRQYLPSI